jgi:hypothetical protein
MGVLEGVPAIAAYMHRRRSPPRIPQLLPHRQRPDESASGIVELAVHMPQKTALNQCSRTLCVQDPGRDRAETAAAAPLGPARVISRLA